MASAHWKLTMVPIRSWPAESGGGWGGAIASPLSTLMYFWTQIYFSTHSSNLYPCNFNLPTRSPVAPVAPVRDIIWVKWRGDGVDQNLSMFIRKNWELLLRWHYSKKGREGTNIANFQWYHRCMIPIRMTWAAAISFTTNSTFSQWWSHGGNARHAPHLFPKMANVIM